MRYGSDYDGFWMTCFYDLVFMVGVDWRGRFAWGTLKYACIILFFQKGKKNPIGHNMVTSALLVGA